MQDVLALNKSNKKTLGFMPDEAFSQRASHEGLVLAIDDGNVVGYALYDLPRTYVKLIHVCVIASQRRTGLAKRIVEHVIEKNVTRSGILASCRADYDIDEFWKSLAMTTRSERAGRSVKGSVLKIWWRPLGALDLFESAALSSKLPIAVLDTNVVSDLYSSPMQERPDREESSALAADWLLDFVELMVSPQLDNELARIEDHAERAIQRGLSSALPRLRSYAATSSGLESSLLAFIGKVELARDESLRDDVKHLVDAVGSDARFFVTSDANLIRLLGGHMAEESDLRLVRPYELVTQLLGNSGRQRFESSVLESVNLRWEKADGFDIVKLSDSFVNHANGEKSKKFARRLREGVAHSKAGEVSVLLDDQRRPVALLAFRVAKSRLVVSLIRTGRDYAGTTVAFQLVRHLRRIALGHGLDTVQVVDEELVGPILESLALDGFANADGGPTATLSTAVGPEHLPLGTFETAASVAAVERKYWPLTLIDEVTECWISPIQPQYAEMLFGYGDTLYSDRKAGLGLSREHVFYRADQKPLPVELPARILWYVSSNNKGIDVRLIVGYSRIIESVVLSAPEAFERFRHLGVYRRNQVLDAAGKNGLVNVIRFEDTEMFARPINRAALAPILERHQVKMPFVTLRSIPSALFHEILDFQREPEEEA